MLICKLRSQEEIKERFVPSIRQQLQTGDRRKHTLLQHGGAVYPRVLPCQHFLAFASRFVSGTIWVLDLHHWCAFHMLLLLHAFYCLTLQP